MRSAPRTRCEPSIGPTLPNHVATAPAQCDHRQMISWRRDRREELPPRRLGALRRRWYVVAVTLLATLPFVAKAHAGPRDYEKRASVVLLAPADVHTRNAYLSFNGSLVTTADVLSREVTSAESVAALRRTGATAPFEVQLANSGSEELPLWDQPTLNVLVHGRSEPAVVATLHLVVKDI